MDYIIVCAAALLASGLTLFSGFGLGTLLMPVFALFFPVEAAIAMTAVVHLANNLFKIGLVARDADWRIVIRFGIPATLAALLGAGLLTMFSGMESLFEYELGSQTREITPVKLMIGLLITGFVALELSPRFARLALPPSWIPLGGLLSGFFGGLSGNQGALRSAFLIKAGLSKEAFVGTSAVCAVMVDAVRLSIYWAAFHASGWKVLQGDEGNLVLAASLSAFLGAYFGKKLLKKVTLRTVELSVAGMMGLIGIALLTGLL
ncbi:TSUP family transporter [Azonexus hydrophilus]|uniref:TSUP family transporter n=1 Tax=Azonexus hydrophilus TaxID=418702 RepID=UPI002492B066|nr:TSUP family transporter [Azonexus hydrophilus]